MSDVNIKVFKGKDGAYYALLQKEHANAREIVKKKYNAKFGDAPTTDGGTQKAWKFPEGVIKDNKVQASIYNELIAAETQNQAPAAANAPSHSAHQAQQPEKNPAEVLLRVYKHPVSQALCVDLDKKYEAARNHIKTQYGAKWETIPASSNFPEHKAFILVNANPDDQKKIYGELKRLTDPQASQVSGQGGREPAPISVSDKDGKITSIIVPAKIDGKESKIEFGPSATQQIAEFLKAASPEFRASLGV